MLHLVRHIRDAIHLWAAQASQAPSSGRTVLIPSERVAHAIRRELARHTEHHPLLIGTRFVRPITLAEDILLHAGKPLPGGREDILPVALEVMFDRNLLKGKLKYFDLDQLRTGSGYADAFARTLDDLDAAGISADDLRAAAKKADSISKGRYLDLAVIMDELDMSCASAHQIFRAAADFTPTFNETVFAVMVREPAPSEMAFLGALTALQSAFVTARPDHPSFQIAIDRMSKRLGGLQPQPVATTANRQEISILRRYFFSSPEELHDAARTASSGPDGSVQLEFHSGAREELDTAVDWVCEQIRAGTPLEGIAILVRPSDPLAGIMYDRLANLPWPTDDPPLYVPGGVSITDTMAGMRMLALIHALAGGLAADDMLRILPILRLANPVGPHKREHLKLSEVFELIQNCGTLGGTPVRPEGAVEWRAGLERRITHLELLASINEKEISYKKKMERDHAIRYLDPFKAILPPLQALTALAELLHTNDAPLSQIWPALAALWKEHILSGPDVVLKGLHAQMAAVLELPRNGSEALDVIEKRLRRMRRHIGRFGEPRIFIGSLEEAAGLPFTAVRVMGLAEGVIGGAGRDDPLLPDSSRKDLSPNLRLSSHDSLNSLQMLYRAVQHAEERIVISAPRQTLDGIVRDASSVYLEVAAALRRPNAETGRHGKEFLNAKSVIRDYFLPARQSAVSYLKIIPACPATTDLEAFYRKLAVPGPDDGLFLKHPPERPEYMSAGKIDTLLTCPHKYLLEHIFHWGEPAELPDGIALDALTYGSLFHSVMEDFFSVHAESFYAHKKPPGKFLELALDVGRRKIEDLIRFYPLVGAHARVEQMNKLGGDIERALQHEWERGTSVSVAHVELPYGYDAPVEIEGLRVRGFVDRIDVVGDRSLIRDFKTGSAKLNRPDDPPDPRVDLQLALYSLVIGKLARTLKLPPPGGAMYVYSRTQRFPERKYEGAEFRALMESGKVWINLARRMMEQGAYVRTSNSKKDCAYCPYTFICGDAPDESKERLSAQGGVVGEFYAFKTPED